LKRAAFAHTGINIAGGGCSMTAAQVAPWMRSVQGRQFGDDITMWVSAFMDLIRESRPPSQSNAGVRPVTIMPTSGVLIAGPSRHPLALTVSKTG
jgi:hypothetical protein